MGLSFKPYLIFLQDGMDLGLAPSTFGWITLPLVVYLDLRLAENTLIKRFKAVSRKKPRQQRSSWFLPNMSIDFHRSQDIVNPSFFAGKHAI